ncbi:hypothetical protein JX266_007245 [Neoarthrinium moseri]|nr:hypothetical protein JX266_007245 [Neoarthrinium moseri]
MASRFVSGGTIVGSDTSTPPSHPTPTDTTAAAAAKSQTADPKSSAWATAQAQLEAERRARQAARKTAIESGGSGQGQSLYEVLQANKEAKQAAFEEANKIKNQFRALDDDEVDFLEGIVADERREEEERRREVERSLREFRDAQKKGTATAEAEVDEPLDRVVADGADEWSTAGAKKRKREKEHVIKGIKRRASEAAREQVKTDSREPPDVNVTERAKPAATVKSTTPNKEMAPKPKMGLVDYGSDDDDDDD